MADCPSFDGFRSPDLPKKELIESFKRMMEKEWAEQKIVVPYSPEFARLDWEKESLTVKMVATMEGELGQAWDRVVALLSSAISDPMVMKNRHAVEFLEIMRSVAATASGCEDVDLLMQVFRPVFSSQNAWANSMNSKPDPSVRRWVVDEWFDRADKGQSKAAFSRQYAALVKQKFEISVTPDTIARDWLPKPKRRP